MNSASSKPPSNAAVQKQLVRTLRRALSSRKQVLAHYKLVLDEDRPGIDTERLVKVISEYETAIVLIQQQLSDATPPVNRRHQRAA